MLKIGKYWVEVAIVSIGQRLFVLCHSHSTSLIHSSTCLAPTDNTGLSKRAFSPSFSRWYLTWSTMPRGNQLIQREKAIKQRLTQKALFLETDMEEGSGIITLPFSTYLPSIHHVPCVVWEAEMETVTRLDPCFHQLPFSPPAKQAKTSKINTYIYPIW